MGFFLALAAGASGITIEDFRKEFAPKAHDVAIVSDAIHRFTELSGASEDVAMRHVIPIVIPFPDKRCVYFWIRGLQLGSGVKIYCYKKENDELIEALVGDGQ